MNTDFFYEYDLYTLEHKFYELEVIETLDRNVSLNKSIETFTTNVVNLLYSSIKEGKKVKTSEIQLPHIDKDLEESLSENSFYLSYKAQSKESLSGVVLKNFLSRIFQKDGHNDERYVIQNYIYLWVEKKLALRITQDSRFNSIEILKALLDKTELMHGFYHYLVEAIPNGWILVKGNEWVEIDISPERLIDSMRTFGRPYFEYYLSSTLKLPKERIWDFVQEVTRYSDHMMLGEEFSFRSSVLIKHNLLLWIEFWDNLSLPIIQDCVFVSFFNFKPQQYLQLLAALVNDKVAVRSDVKVLLLIIAQNYFEASNRLTERLSIYEDLERRNSVNKDIFSDGDEVRKAWARQKQENYEEVIQFLQIKLSKSDIEDWIFSYKPRVNNSKIKQNEIYNSEIASLLEAYECTFAEFTTSDLESFNLQKFNFYVKRAVKKDIKKAALDLLAAMTNYVESEAFFWDRTYTEPYWSALKGLGFVMSQHDNAIQNARELINKFSTNHQGWKPVGINSSLIIKESFVYSGIALMFENEIAFKEKIDRERFFKELLTHVLTQDSFSQTDNSEYYQIPLHLLFLVSNQIIPELKEYYERELICNYDNLFSLLVILSTDRVPICDRSKILLQERIEKEYLLLKRQFTSRRQEGKAQELEKMIEILNLES